MPTRRSINTLLAIGLILFAGCGGSGSDSASTDPPSVDELVGLVPKDSTSALTLDVAAAREEVDERRLQPLVESTIVGYPGRDYEPLYRALDASAVTGIVRSDGPPEILLIGTTQTWDEARAAFEREGWKPDPANENTLKHPDARYSEALLFVTGRDGLIVLSGFATAAAEARDGKSSASPALRKLIAGVDGPARGARLGELPCVGGKAIGYRPSQGGGELAVTVDGPADASRARDNGTGAGQGYTFDDPRAEGDRIVVPFRKPAGDDAFREPAPDGAGDAWFFDYECSSGG